MREAPRGVCPPGIVIFLNLRNAFCITQKAASTKINFMKWEIIIATISMTDSHNSLIREK